MVTTPTSPKSSLRSLERTSDVSMSSQSSRSSVSDNRAPRGTAMVRSGMAVARGQRLVEVVDAQCEADRGQRAAEAPEQVVVAAAAAERRAEPRVVHLEHRARVVAEVAREAEIDDEPPRDLGRETLVEAQQAVGRVADRVADLLEHLGAAAQARDAQQQARVRVVDAQHAELALHPHEVARGQLAHHTPPGGAVDARLVEQPREQRSVAETDAELPQPGRLERA